MAAARSLTQARSREELEPASSNRLHNFLRENFADNIAADVRDGLTCDPKSLPSK